MSRSALSPSVMLATSMHAQPGVYAVLLGSGVSTGAGVPTGWGVIEELVRRVAAAATPDDAEALRLAQDDAEAWWAKYGEGELGYSAILKKLAPTASARQGLLAGSFEATDEDRDQGIKVPSKAHHAIAQLVERGLVKVILTTNFDRLMEQALELAGVAPQVVGRPEAVNGMAPLAHSDATVVKLHGDYKDLGTRNTAEELSEYPREWTTLLRQVFDEYGLVVCGWSASWDVALVGALQATPNRRYPLYWDSRSGKSNTAQGVITNRNGLIIESTGADEMLSDLLASVESLDRLAQPPLTTAMAVARLKRHLPDPVRRIDLHDLVMDAAQDVAAGIAEQPVSMVPLDGAGVQRIYERYLETTTPLIHMLVTGVWHDTDGTHDRLWVDTLQRLIDAGTAPISSATPGLDDARLWPALFAMSAMGVAAVRRDRERLMIRLSTEPQGRARKGTAEPMNASQLLHPNRLLEKEWVDAMPRWGHGHAGWIYPASHLLKADIRPFFANLTPLDNDYELTFHGYEYRLGLVQENRSDGRGYRAISGEYVGEKGWSWANRDIPLAEINFREAAERSRDWPWGDYLEGNSLDQVLINHREILGPYRNRW